MKFRPSATVVLGTVAVLLVAVFAWSLRAFSRYQPYDMLNHAMSGPEISFGLAMQDVDLQGCQAGARQWSFHAARLVLSRDRTQATADQLTDGILYQQGRPVASFAAGHAQADMGPFGPAMGTLTLSKTARFRSLGAMSRRVGAPIAVSAPTLSWNARQDRIGCSGPAIAVLGSFGRLSASALQFDTRSKVLSAGQFHLVAQASALPPVLPESPAASSAPSGSTVHIDAPEGGTFNEETSVVTLRGPVTFTQKDASVETVGGTYDRRANFARSKSPVTLKDSEMTLTGDEGTVDFTRHIATLTGDIHLTVKPKPAEKSADQAETEAREPAVMTCDQIVYNYHTKQADATGHFVIHQKDRTVTAQSGHYDAAAELVTLNGPVHYTTPDGQSFVAPAAVVSIKPGHETVDVNGPINGDFPVNNQNSPPLPGH